MNSDKFISRLDNKNTMNIDLTVDIISFRFYSGKGFWIVNWELGPSLAPHPEEYVQFARYANIDPDSFRTYQYDIRDMELHADIF